MKSKKLTVVTCRCNELPAAEAWELGSERDAESELRRSQEVVDGEIEVIPYPRHLNRPKLSVVTNGEGLLHNLPYNRWGLAGNFYVVRYGQHGWQQSLSDKGVDTVIHDLQTDLGYLDERSGVFNFFREKGMDREPPPDPFFFINPNWPDYFKEGRTRQSLPAGDFEKKGGKWRPQLHFTGGVSIEETRFIETLLDEYANQIVAHHFAYPLPGMYSVELQFGASEADQAAMSECLQRYLDHFDDEKVEDD